MAFDEPEEKEEIDRKERRWNIPIPVVVRGVRSDGTEFKEESITADASPAGMCLLLTAALKRGDQVTIIAPEEKFEAPATVRNVNSLGTMNRIRIAFPKEKQFTRALAEKKYVYDYYYEHWVGYIQDNTYYNTKYEPFGKIEGGKIVAMDTGGPLFNIREDAVFDERGNKIGYII